MICFTWKELFWAAVIWFAYCFFSALCRGIGSVTGELMGQALKPALAELVLLVKEWVAERRFWKTFKKDGAA